MYQVSRHMNHLLKAPFCIHPKTGFNLKFCGQAITLQILTRTYSKFCYTHLCLDFVLTSTGRVCVPIDPNCCEEFDPTAVPTLSEVNANTKTSIGRVAG